MAPACRQSAHSKQKRISNERRRTSHHSPAGPAQKRADCHHPYFGTTAFTSRPDKLAKRKRESIANEACRQLIDRIFMRDAPFCTTSQLMMARRPGRWPATESETGAQAHQDGIAHCECFRAYVSRASAGLLDYTGAHRLLEPRSTGGRGGIPTTFKARWRLRLNCRLL